MGLLRKGKTRFPWSPAPLPQPGELIGWNNFLNDDGLALWEGKDSIINLDQIESGKNIKDAGGLLIVGGVSMAFLLTIVQNVIGRSQSGPMTFASIFIVAGVMCLLVYGSKPKWIGATWRLAGNSTELLYSGDTSWRVSLDDISSVEVGRTRDFTPSRTYNGNLKAVPDHEWQTFIVVRDQTRRAIYHANAGRDECAALRASIAAYVEAARAALPAPSAAPLPPSASPSGEGFDL